MHDDTCLIIVACLLIVVHAHDCAGNLISTLLLCSFHAGKSSTDSGGDSMMKCVRHSLKIVETCSQEDKEK